MAGACLTGLLCVTLAADPHGDDGTVPTGGQGYGEGMYGGGAGGPETGGNAGGNGGNGGDGHFNGTGGKGQHMQGGYGW